MGPQGVAPLLSDAATENAGRPQTTKTASDAPAKASFCAAPATGFQRSRLFWPLKGCVSASLRRRRRFAVQPSIPAQRLTIWNRDRRRQPAGFVDPGAVVVGYQVFTLRFLRRSIAMRILSCMSLMASPRLPSSSFDFRSKEASSSPTLIRRACSAKALTFRVS